MIENDVTRLYIGFFAFVHVILFNLSERNIELSLWLILRGGAYRMLFFFTNLAHVNA